MNKTFDRVSHNILLEKLTAPGLGRGTLRWVKKLPGWLGTENDTNGVKSSWQMATSGVYLLESRKTLKRDQRIGWIHETSQLHVFSRKPVYGQLPHLGQLISMSMCSKGWSCYSFLKITHKVQLSQHKKGGRETWKWDYNSTKIGGFPAQIFLSAFI